MQRHLWTLHFSGLLAALMFWARSKLTRIVFLGTI
jgi:hypothetical protein